MVINLIAEAERRFIKSNKIKSISAYNTKKKKIEVKVFTKSYDSDGNLVEENRFRQLNFGKSHLPIGEIICKHQYKYEFGKKTEEIKSYQNRIPIELDDYGYLIFKRLYKYDESGKLKETVWIENENYVSGKCTYQYEHDGKLVDIEFTAKENILHNIIFSYRDNLVTSVIVNPYNPKHAIQSRRYKNYKLNSTGELEEIEIFDKYGRNGRTYKVEYTQNNYSSLVDYNDNLKVILEHY
ncbi:MAG: hypothetical protein AB7G44_13690 [Bacteroidia bacterium]